MSHDATSWAKAQKTGHGTAKLILLLLADYAGTDYSCYPSVKKLAEVSELAESTVRSMTKLLAEQGLIRVFYRYRDNRTRRSSRYQLLVDGPETMEPDADDWDHHRQVPAEVQRQEPADTPQEPADSHRQELALIPYKEPSPREPSLVTPGASRTPKATRLPDDFLPTEEMKHWFAAENLHLVINDPRTEHETFCDYWHAKAGADARKLDWAATWRNWMRKAASRGNGGGASGAYRSGPTGPVGPNGAYRSTTDTKVQQTLNLAEKYRQMEENQ